MFLLASDFDNTLLFDEKMKNEDIKAIHKFQNRGHLFGVCSGRSLSGILKPSLPYGIQYDFYILLSGALILNKDKDVIFERQIPMQLVLDIEKDVHCPNASVVYHDKMYSTSSKCSSHVQHISSFTDLNTDSVSAFSLHFEKDELKQAMQTTKYINEKYGQWLVAFQNNEHIDMAMKGCSKGEGMKMIQDYFQLSDEQVHGIGDSWNDLPMLDAISNSYSFDYSHPSVQAHAKTIVSSVAECIKNIEKKDNL